MCNGTINVMLSIFSISKTKQKSLSRTDRVCEEKADFNWGDCLDEEFYLRKGSFFSSFFSVIYSISPFRLPGPLVCEPKSPFANLH